MAPVLEILRVAVSDAFTPELEKPALDIASQAPGLLKIFSGLQADDPKRYVLYNVWETIEDHQKLTAHPEALEPFKAAFTKYAAGVPDIIHIIGNRDPTEPLSAPVTELCIAKIKPGITKEVASQRLATLSDSVYAPQAIAAGAHGSTWGEIPELEGYLGMIVGWTTPQDLPNVLANSEAVQKIVHALHEAVEVDIKISVLKPYSK